MSTSTIAGDTLVKINVWSPPSAVAFQWDGKHVVCACRNWTIERWRIEDGESVSPAKEAGSSVRALAISKDGGWIVAGTAEGLVLVWDPETDQALNKILSLNEVSTVDVSPDSKTFAIGSKDHGVSIWDIETGRKLVELPNDGSGLDNRVRMVRFSPLGHRIAAASDVAIRVFDSHSGTLLTEILNSIHSTSSASIAWSSDGRHIFAVKLNTLTSEIKQFDSSTGSLYSEWLAHVHNDIDFVSISLAHSGQFIVYAASRFVTFWDTLTHTQVGHTLELTNELTSLAISPDDNRLAIGQLDNSLTVRSLGDILPQSYLLNTLALSPENPLLVGPELRKEPTSQGVIFPQGASNVILFIHLSDLAFSAWIQGKLGNAESVLTQEINHSSSSRQHASANRALIQARLRQWSEAVKDAKKSMAIQPSVAGLLANSIALLGMGEIDQGYQTLDHAFRHCDTNEIKLLELIKYIIIYEAGKRDQAISHVKQILDTTDNKSIGHFVLAYMCLMFGIEKMRQHDYNSAISLLKHDEIPIQSYDSPQLIVISLIFGWVFDGIDIVVRRKLCEALGAAGYTWEAVVHLHKLVDAFDEDLRPSKSTTDWITTFLTQCIETLLGMVQVAPTGQKKDEAITHCSIALSLKLPAPQRRSIDRSRERASKSMWGEALNTANEAIMLDPLSPWGYERKRAALHGAGNYDDAIQAHKMMLSLLAKSPDPLTRPLLYQYVNPSITEAIIRGIVERTLRGAPRQSIHTVTGRLHDKALQVSTFEASSTCKELVSSMATHIDRAHIEQAVARYFKYVTLPQSWDSDQSLSQIIKNNSIYDLEQSPVNNQLREACLGARDAGVNYVDFVDKEAIIYNVVEQTIRDLPRVLIDTTTGRLIDKAEQAASFGTSTTYRELASSMTTQIDRREIEQVVEKYYRYVMLSHKWGYNEPLFQMVQTTSIYQLDPSPENRKLQNFCLHARNAGFKWAWSDTCCIDKSNLVVLQESLVSMFKWYRGSALTIVYLQDVRSPSKHGDLTTSLWNTRAWTYQEYVAAEVIQFYIEDWTPYLGLHTFDANLHIVNHKVAQAIIADMGKAVRIDSGSQDWLDLRPGFDNIREKLCLASTRQTALIEDAAYSLLGIFSISMPVIYGEGESALARLLGNVLTGSGDASILAWTGESSSYNSCLPARITVFSQLATSHLPSHLTDVEMISAITISHAWLDSNLSEQLYRRLHDLPPPWFAANRLKLPCITFQLEHVKSLYVSMAWVYHARTTAFGTVEIWTTENLSQFNNLCLVHPWISSLLDPGPVDSDMFTSFEGEAPLSSSLHLNVNTAHENTNHDSSPLLSRPASPVPTPPPPMDTLSRADRLLARLRQPFGALLLAQRVNGIGFRRVASDSLITVQLRDDVPLNHLIDNVRTLEVL